MTLTSRAGRFSALLLVLALAVACSAGADQAGAPSDDTAGPAAKPLVLLGGDSVMENLSQGLLPGLRRGDAVEARFLLGPTVADDAASTYFWAEKVDELDPDVIVLLLGVWETALAEFTPEQPGWMAQYQADRLEPFADTLTAQGAHLLWVGVPTVSDPQWALEIASLNNAFESVADARPDVDYLDANEFVTADGTYTEVLPGPDGQPERIRQTDGLHLCTSGVVRLATPVLSWLDDELDVETAPGWQTAAWSTQPPFTDPALCPAPPTGP